MNDSAPQDAASGGIAPSGFAGEIGVEWLDLSPDGAKARIAIERRHLQPYGIVHGGVHSSLVESLTSAATYEAVKDEGKIAMGQTIETSFLRPMSEGGINATAIARHRGSTTWLWDVEITDDEGRVCALSRMTIAVRKARS